MGQSDPSNDGTSSGRLTRTAMRKINACAGVATSSNPNEGAHALQQMRALMTMRAEPRRPEYQLDLFA